MKNPNSPVARLKKGLVSRWSAEDYPGAEPRFQIPLFVKDVAVFVLLPVFSVLLFKTLQGGSQTSRRPNPAPSSSDRLRLDAPKSQIISFGTSGGASGSGAPRRSPGSLVHVRLLNLVETYSSAPVHAQITDASLGGALKGGTLIGDATPDTSFDRISIAFRFARDPNREGVAIPITARALSLDGTLGLEADKKEGFVARSAIGSAAIGSQNLQNGGSSSNDFRDILLKALSAGLFQEMGTSTQVERNRAQVLTLAPDTEFYAELTDFFPGGSR